MSFIHTTWYGAPVRTYCATLPLHDLLSCRPLIFPLDRKGQGYPSSGARRNQRNCRACGLVKSNKDRHNAQPKMLFLALVQHKNDGLFTNKGALKWGIWHEMSTCHIFTHEIHLDSWMFHSSTWVNPVMYLNRFCKRRDVVEPTSGRKNNIWPRLPPQTPTATITATTAAATTTTKQSTLPPARSLVALLCPTAPEWSRRLDATNP